MKEQQSGIPIEHPSTSNQRFFFLNEDQIKVLANNEAAANNQLKRASTTLAFTNYSIQPLKHGLLLNVASQHT